MSLTVIQKTEYYTICRCYIACMTVVGDTPDIDFRYMRGFYILSLAYNIKMIECVVKISLNLLIKVSKIHSNNSN
jgi:hypothetical protein